MSESKNYKSIMISSTFTDLKEHRQFAKEAIEKFGFHAEAMESSGANAHSDVIDTSLQMVRNAAAYIGVVSHKYGQIPECERRNAECVSITELEFEEAEKEGRHRIIFIMSDDHPVKKSDVESDPEKIKKLNAFRERVKRMKSDAKVQRIYETFDSVEDFARKASIAIGNLAKLLEQSEGPKTPPQANAPSSAEAPLPMPPALRAMPRYRGSHSFVGRAAQLDTLNEWASPANQNPLLLFEAMGGSGKSILTWHWTTQCAEAARDDWAGRFWYSFYEKGAVMADFCREALAYMTGREARDFEQLPQSKLSEQLLAQLNARPWLLVLDGLERVLVAYHRNDAAQLRDHDVDSAIDPMGTRKPRQAIRREDDDLLRALAGAEPSRVLVSTRLTPLALLSPSDSLIPGVRREELAGLRPEDAEAMMRSCGIRGDSAKMRAYLQSNCDCHPLVTGVIAGLINRNVQSPGNFDKWVADPEGGDALNLGELDLKQRQNHILGHAIDGVEGDERHVLNLLSLFPRAADYDVLRELAKMNDALDEARLKVALSSLRDHGLLQYDEETECYDLHPVVRGVVAGRMDEATTEAVGEALVDHFTAVPRNPWEQAQTLEDVQSGMDLVATLLRLEKYEAAFVAYVPDLSNALIFNLEAFTEKQRLLRPFFPNGWAGNLKRLSATSEGYLSVLAGWSLRDDDKDQSNKLFERALRIYIRREDWSNVNSCIRNLEFNAREHLAVRFRLLVLMADGADQFDHLREIFTSRLQLYAFHVEYGDPSEAERLWVKLDTMGRNWPRTVYRPSDLEFFRALDLFQRGHLDDATLATAEALAIQGHNSVRQRDLRWLRGQWQLEHRCYTAAAQSFEAAIQMARERGREDREYEAWRALALSRSGAIDEALLTAEELGDVEEGGTVALAELWHELGDQDRALVHAQRAHDWAVNDGEPYVRRYWLNRIRALYAKMGVEPPEVPVYDPAAHPPFDWEADVRALIEKMKAERAALEAYK